jgi:hypothetical protein
MNFTGDQTRAGSSSHARELIAVVSSLVREFRGSSTHVNVTLSSRLDRDLGIDSLGREPSWSCASSASFGYGCRPGVLRGTRSILRSDQWFPRWGQIDVQILDAFAPEGADFASILRLRDAVRGAVLAHCGEPDLRELVKPLREGTHTLGVVTRTFSSQIDPSKQRRGGD